MTDPDHIDGTADEVAPDPPAPAASTEVAVLDTARVGTYLVADEPEQILEKAHRIAKPLAKLVESAGLAKHVGGQRKHVEVGGWQACGALLGTLGGQPLHAETIWARPVVGEDGHPRRTAYTATVKRYYRRDQGGGLREEVTYEVDGYDWEACVEVRTATGAVVGRAEAMCARDEESWSRRPDYAVRSMAETRAESRAYRRAIGWIVHLAGYSPTPADEMPATPEAPAALPDWAVPASDDLIGKGRRALAYLLGDDPTGERVAAVLGELEKDYGQPGCPRAAARALVHVALAHQRAMQARQDAPAG